jgi:hypothetical protein
MATKGDYGTIHCNPAARGSTSFGEFNTHLIALLSVYELGPSSRPLPEYNGPANWQTDAILRSLAALAHRAYAAEETLASIKAEDTYENAIKPDVQNRRSLSSCSDSSDYVVVGKSPPMLVSSDFTSTSAKYVSSDIGGLDDNESGVLSLDCEDTFDGLVGPLQAATPFKNEMSSLEELRLLKAQVSDIARVCNAVAKGDLGQMVTVPVQGVVMRELNEIVNTMVI